MSSALALGTTLLFGGTGFIGSALLRRRADIVSVGRRQPRTGNRHIHIDSLNDLSALKSLSFDNVIFLIGNSDHHTMSSDVLRLDRPTAYDHHVGTLISVLEQLKQRPIRKFVHFSTTLLYADRQPKLPVAEDAPIDPFKSRYTLSKHFAEELCTFYGKTVPILNLRITPVYGPTDCPRWDFINTLIAQVVNQHRAEIWSSRPERDFLYVEDAVTAVLELLASDAVGTFNLGSGFMTPLSEVVSLVKALSGCEVVSRDIPVTGPMRFQTDLTKLRQWIDWRPAHSIADGVRLTYEGMQAIHERCA